MCFELALPYYRKIDSYTYIFKYIKFNCPEVRVLTTLNFLSQSDDNVTQVSIAKLADMDVMSASQIIRGLEKKEFIERTTNPEDSRANSVILLPKGQEMVRLDLPIVEKIDEEFFGALHENEVLFRNYLKQLD